MLLHNFALGNNAIQCTRKYFELLSNVHTTQTKLACCTLKKKVSNEVSSFLFYVPTAKRQAGELSTNVLRNDAVLALVTFLFRFGP